MLYADVRKELHKPAARSVLSHLRKLHDEDVVEVASKGLDRVVEDGLGSPLTSLGAALDDRDRDLDRVVAGEVVVAVADLLHHRFVGETDVSGVLAPGVEPASRGRVDRRGSSPSMSPS